MKKQLLTTTALVAAGVLVLSGGAIAADKMKKPSLKISGVFEQGIGMQSYDGNDDDKAVQQQDGEIHFTASMKLDNGITVSGHSQLEVDNDRGNKKDDGDDEIDESYMSVSGSFGRINIGATDAASYKMVYGYMGHAGAGAGHLNLEFDSGDLTGISTLGGATRGLPRVPNDEETLVYFTPRISGLQAGVSYTQSASRPFGSWEDIISSAVNYTGKFGDAGVGAALGYIVGDGAGGGPDVTVLSGGIKVTMGGLTGAAGVVRNTLDNGMPNEDLTRADVGLRYKFGPNAVRVAYITTSDDADVDVNGTIATFARSLGPGVSWSLDAMMTKDKTANEDGSFFGTSVQIKF